VTRRWKLVEKTRNKGWKYGSNARAGSPEFKLQYCETKPNPQKCSKNFLLENFYVFLTSNCLRHLSLRGGHPSSLFSLCHAPV
jgi:hypothetical protein